MDDEANEGSAPVRWTTPDDAPTNLATRIVTAAAARVLGAPAVVRPDATAAAVTALTAAGAGRGTVVLLPDREAAVALAAVRELGAAPVLLASDPRTGAVGDATLRAAVASHPDAVVVLVPVAGMLPSVAGLPTTVVVGQGPLPVPLDQIPARSGWVELPGATGPVHLALGGTGTPSGAPTTAAPPVGEGHGADARSVDAADLRAASAALDALWRRTAAVSVARAELAADLTAARVTPGRRLPSDELAVTVDPGSTPGGAAGALQRCREAGVPARTPRPTSHPVPEPHPEVLLVGGWADAAPARRRRLAAAVVAALTGGGPDPVDPLDAPVHAGIPDTARPGTPAGAPAVGMVGGGPSFPALADALASSVGTVVHAARAAALPATAEVTVVVPSTDPSRIVEALHRGSPVITAFPPAPDPGDARTVLEVARRHGAPLLALAPWRHDEGVRRARAVVRSGVLGTLRHVEVHAGPWWSPWQGDPLGVAVPAAADLVGTLVGPIVEVLAVQPRPGDRRTLVHLVLGSSDPAGDLLPVTVVVTTDDRGADDRGADDRGADDRGADRRGTASTLLRLQGTHGAVVVTDETTALHPAAGGVVPLGPGYRPQAALAAALGATLTSATALASRRRDAARDRDGGGDGGPALSAHRDELLAAVEVLEAVLRSLRRVTWEPVRGVPVIDLRDGVVPLVGA